MPTLDQLIEAHEAWQPAPIVLTPRGRVDVAARRFLEALAGLPADERPYALARLLFAAPGPEPGVTYTLSTLRPPVLDPQL